jgi:hypothetical protein
MGFAKEKKPGKMNKLDPPSMGSNPFKLSPPVNTNLTPKHESFEVLAKSRINWESSAFEYLCSIPIFCAEDRNRSKWSDKKIACPSMILKKSKMPYPRRKPMSFTLT